MYIKRLITEIENYCNENNYDIIKAKKIILENSEAIDGWVENTKIVEEAGKLDDDYFKRTVKGVLKNE